MNNMNKKYADLLKDKEVIEEINRHKWFESEKAGHDIGFEKAAEDWLNRFAATWVAHHSPQKKSEPKKETAKSDAPKTRRARSYIL